MKQIFFLTALLLSLSFSACSLFKTTSEIETTVNVLEGKANIKFKFDHKCSFDPEGPEQYVSHNCYMDEFRYIPTSIISTPYGITTEQMKEVVDSINRMILHQTVADVRFKVVEDWEHPQVRIGSYIKNYYPPFDAFDGKGGTLEYTWWNCFPSIEKRNHIFFDGEEDFSFEDSDTTFNIYTVMAHAFWHLLGCRHNEIKGCLMYPYYGFFDGKLHKDDIAFLEENYPHRTNLQNADTLQIIGQFKIIEK